MKKSLIFSAALLILGVAASAQNSEDVQRFEDGAWLFSISPDAENEVTVLKYNIRNVSSVTEVDIPGDATYNGTRYVVTALGENLFGGTYPLGFPQDLTHPAFRNLERVTIPNTVTTIGARAFDSCSGLTTLSLPNTLTTIGDRVFAGCSGLTTLSLPNTLTTIGDRVFAGCSGLTSLALPNSLTTIGDGVFSGCSGLTTLILPNSLTTIGKSAFYGCSGLTTVTIPASVTSVGQSAFYGCSALKEVLVEPGNENYSSRDGVLYSKSELIRYPQDKEGDTFEIPNTVTDIGAGAFSDCRSLKSVSIPNTVSVIGGAAFCGCRSLKSVSIPNSVTIIENDAFGWTGLTSVTIPNSVTYIGWGAFAATKLTSVTIPASVSSMGGSPFYGCSALKEVLVEAGNENYSSVDGVLCSKTELVCYPQGREADTFEIPNSVTTIGGSAFHRCNNLTSVVIPNSVTTIGMYAFDACEGLESVTIPNSVTSIERGAFNVCTKLAKVTVSGSETTIGDYAFSFCSSLATIYALSTSPAVCGKDVFDPGTSTVVYIPKGTLSAYSVADGWSVFTDFREMGALEISLSKTELSLMEGESDTITAAVSKDDDVAVDSECWSSSNPAVATVENGTVTAVGEGSASIIFTITDNYGVAHSECCVVTVGPGSGIELVEAYDKAPAEYYNLNGLRVDAEALIPGLYVKRRDGKATKILVK